PPRTSDDCPANSGKPALLVAEPARPPSGDRTFRHCRRIGAMGLWPCPAYGPGRLAHWSSVSAAADVVAAVFRRGRDGATGGGPERPRTRSGRLPAVLPACRACAVADVSAAGPRRVRRHAV